MNSFSSKEYKAFATWQKIIFYLGLLFFIHPVYWLVRLIIYLVVMHRPLKERVNFYTRQTYVFGWIVAVSLTLALLIVSTLLLLALVFGVALLPWLALPMLQ